MGPRGAVMRMLRPLWFLALVACVSAGGDGTSPLADAAIEVTALPAVEEAAAAPEAPPEPEPEPQAAPAPLSPEARACQRQGGTWIRAGVAGLMTCQRQTGEGLKSCRRASDCAGECLARSGTCAPVTPLFGCNEVLDGLGRRVSQCVN